MRAFEDLEKDKGRSGDRLFNYFGSLGLGYDIIGDAIDILRNL